MANTTVQIKKCLETKTGADVSKNDGIYKLLSFDETKEVVRHVLDNDANLVEYAIRPYSEGKLGYLGSHYRLDVIAARKSKIVSLSFFLKSIPYEVPDQADYVIKKGVFEQETKFYSRIMPLLREGYRGEPWAPMCYKVKDNLMIFEELSNKDYSIRDKLFDETLVRAGLCALARMHAASLLAEERLGMSFNQLYPEAFVERAFVQKGLTRKWFEVGVDVTATVARRLGYDSDLVRSVCEQIYPAMKPSSTKTNVVSHGDLWGNNLMFNEDVPPKCLLVDFQLLRYSPLAHDIAQFLYLCTDRSFRETQENAMLRHYYEALCDTLNAHETRMQKPSWSEVIEGIEEQRLAAVITAAVIFPTVLMDKSLGVQVMQNSATYAQYNFWDRKEFVFLNMEKDKIYERRINETVVELAELASRLDQLMKPS